MDSVSIRRIAESLAPGGGGKCAPYNDCTRGARRGPLHRRGAQSRFGRFDRHTDANYEQTRFAIAQGARSATHTYNAMRPFTHRDPGVIGAVLTSPEINAELIADGVHVEEAAMKLLLKAKGYERVILVSDGLSATGMPDGKYMLGGFEVTVTNGVCRNAAGILAGSTLTLDRALRNIVKLGVPLADAARMLTLNPATLLGIEFKKGSLRVGADADVLLLDQDLRVTEVWARGVPVH